MKKVFHLFIYLYMSFTCYSQVGIGTAEPKAILHIKASDTLNPARTDGILLPRITKFPAIDPNGSHHGLLVHLTDTTTYATQTKPPGFYYWHFPSRRWINIHTAITNILGSYWSITGNTGTDASTNFIGTTDDKSLNFKVNNITAGTIQNNSPNSTAFGYNTLANNPTGIYNSAFGHSALTSNTTGYENTAVGYSALASNTISRWNTAIGSQALKSNTIGIRNVAIGSRTLPDLVAGESNTAVGEAALHSVTNASYNTAIGDGAMFASKDATSIENNVAVGSRALYQVKGSNNVGIGKSALSLLLAGNYNIAIGSDVLSSTQTGNDNVAVGYRSMFFNTSGGSNTAIGHQSLYSNSASSITAVGYQSLYSNTTGLGNTANGYQSLYSNTTGFSNTANGYQSLYSNTAGNYNTANGNQSLYSNITGFGNTAMGYSSLKNNTSGGTNTAYGLSALYTNTTGSNNTTGGAYSLNFNTTGGLNTAYGAYALYNNITGSENTAIGFRALAHNEGGKNNVAIGNNSGPNSYTLNLENTVAIGYGTEVTASNSVRIGNDQITTIGGQVAWTAVSDGRIKDDVKEDVPGIDFIKTLRPVTYNLNTNKQNTILNPSYVAKSEKSEIEKIRQTGFIAQEVEASAKKLSYNFSGVNVAKSENDLYGLSYATFVVPLVKAVQEQQEVIERLLKQNQELEKRLLKLEATSK